SRGCTRSSSLSLPRGDQTLLVRHLPAELTTEEKEDLLKYFKAQLVHVLSDKGQLKHAAFTPSVVEFAKEKDQAHSPCPTSVSKKKKNSDDPVKDELGYLTVENGIAPNHGLTFPNSCLRYVYPLPSSTILANRVNALASMPKFYVQVLHLMNKMNLPKPFRPITVRPPMYEDHMPLHAPLPPTSPQPPEEPPWPDDDKELSREELEDESKKKRKLKDMLSTLLCTSHSSLHLVLLPSDVFDQPQPVGNKRIEFHISTDMPAAFKKDLEKKQNFDASNIGFGKIFPKPNLNITEEIKEDSDEMPSECVSRRELEKDRISREEMKTLSVSRSYEPGEPNCRIYVKNLAKHVQEKDLKYIFGRYVDFSSETQWITFDIRLMKEDHMKGQAFTGLPKEKAAAKALKEGNGYMLFGKPMVVQFARSPRPKQDPKEGKRKC
uniref:RNA-binding region-containing protein 3 n=1 Tax=Colobus angolensis palliatus TaxID=336983 RepID=A0A2K5HP32_COLAP